MARNDNIPNFCTDVANAIRNKLKITDEILASEFDTKIREINTGTGINGQIAEYTAGGEINKGQFVKLIDGNVTKIESTNDTILGIAKANAIEGQSIEVYIPLSPPNLFNKNNITIGYRVGSSGSDYADANYFVSDYIEIKPNRMYTVNYEMSAYTRIAFYDKDKTFIIQNTANEIFTTPLNAIYLRLGNTIDMLDAVVLQEY